MNILSKLAVALTLAMIPLHLTASELHIGFVDLERILRESTPAVQAAKKIEKEFSSREDAIKKLTGQVRELQDYLEKKGAGLSSTERRSKERELSNQSAELQRRQREFREDLNQRKNEELSVLLERANKAIQEIAKRDRYDLILQEAVYRNPRIDITDKVLKALTSEK